jgi:hypothetical protein
MSKCSFVESFDVMKCEGFNFVSFQDCFGYLSLEIIYEFYDGFLNICQKIIFGI